MAPSLSVWPPLPPGAYAARRHTGSVAYPLGDPRCVLFARARDGLLRGLRAHGLGPGDEVLMPAWHHGSEVNAVLATGASCRFYDVGLDLRPDAEEVDSLISPRVRALHLTHFLGLPQDAAWWRDWCDRRHLLLVEDAAQAWLAYDDQTPVGSLGDLAVWCLYKTIGLPDGAAVVSTVPVPPPGPTPTGLPALARRHVAWLAQHAPVPRRVSGTYDPERDMALGPAEAASRATQHLLARADVEHVADRRRSSYRRWDVALTPEVTLTSDGYAEGAVPLVYPLLVEDKGAAVGALRAVGIEPLDVWRVAHPALSGQAFPGAELLRRHLLGLPVHQELPVRALGSAIAAAASTLRPLMLQP